MKLTALEKDLVLAILNRADGEDLDEIVNKSLFEEYITRSLILRSSNVNLKNTLGERNELRNMNNKSIVKYKQSDIFKEFLAKAMSEIDALHLTDRTEEDHYNGLIEWRDFDLLRYWLVYNGVFDGGEDMLEHIKILGKRHN